MDARGVAEHFEADGIFTADEFLFGIDADVQMVGEKIIIGAIGAVFAAKEIGARGRCRRLGWGRGGALLRGLGAERCSGGEK